MLSLGKKSSSFLTLALIVAIWPSGKKQDSQPYLKDGNLKKFREISIKPFDVPYPPEQHHIFETVQEVPEPIPSQKSSGKIPSWLQGKKFIILKFIYSEKATWFWGYRINVKNQVGDFSKFCGLRKPHFYILDKTFFA